MRFTDSILIHAPLDDVWAAVDDEQLLPEWNPKVIEVSNASAGPRRVGYQYQVTFEMRGQRNCMRAVVVERQRPTRLVIRLEPTDVQHFIATERYTLTTQRMGVVRVLQEIELSRAGLPWWARALMWMVQRFGKPVDTPYLAKLKELVEGTVSPAPPAR